MLAASRPQDPVARHAGQSHKALVQVGGVAMLVRVAACAAREPQRRTASRSAWRRARRSPAPSPSSTRLLAERRGDPGRCRRDPEPQRRAQPSARCRLPLLVTTADHPLLTAAMVDHFCAAVPPDADARSAVVAASLLQRRYPDAIRTYYRFAGEGYSGCNLFLLRSPDALRVVDFWTRLERHRKRPWRLIAEVGPLALLRFCSAASSLEGAHAPSVEAGGRDRSARSSCRSPRPRSTSTSRPTWSLPRRSCGSAR